MNPNLKKTITKTFVTLINDLKDEKEINAFLNDFLNDAELETYTKRLAVAYWLKKGRDYKNIQNNLKVNMKEIKETEKLLNTPGMKLALKKVEAEEWANVWNERIKKIWKQ